MTPTKVLLFLAATVTLVFSGMNLRAADGMVTGAGIILFSPKEYQVSQRQTREDGDIRISGRCTLVCDRVEARLRGPCMDKKIVLSPKKWTPVPLNPVTGGFNISITTPAGGWYDFDIRVWQDGKLVALQNVPHVGVGEVFIGAGQSNSTSCGGLGSTSPLDGRTQPESGKVSTFDGNSWRLADDPQPGAHDIAQYTYGSFWPAFGDAMVAAYNVPIGVAVTGHGGSSIKQWKKDGELFNWTLSRMRQFGPNGFRAVLWHQGEGDADMPAPEYADGLGQIIRDFKQAAGWEFPWFVAHASYRPNKPLNEAGSRGGQKLLWEQKNALEGPDTDVMTGNLRDKDGQGIHFSKKGLEAHGKAWAEKIRPYLDKSLEPAEPPKGNQERSWWQKIYW